MGNRLGIDFETRSKVDLRKHGLSRYARDPSTEILCLAYKVNKTAPKIWVPGMPIPEVFQQAIDENWVVPGFNVPFERYIWQFIGMPRHQFPELPLRLLRCTMARSACNGLPRGLGRAAIALELKEAAKSDEGHKLMLKMTKPRKPTKKDPRIWIEDEESLKNLQRYCKQDTVAEEAVEYHTTELHPFEQEVWRVDRIINERGIPIDVPLCKGAVKILNAAKKAAVDELKQITDNVITSPWEVKRIIKYVAERGVNIGNLQEPTVAAAVKDSTIDPTARRVLQIRSECQSAAVKKFQAAVDLTDEDGRCREQLWYYKASTGRWAGKGIQPHNFKRNQAINDQVIRAILSGDFELCQLLWGSKVVPVLATAIKGLVCAPEGYSLVSSDLAGIEARVLQWVAGHERVLQMFRDGADIYKDMASKIYACSVEDVNKAQRQLGKTAVLGLGYQMGAAKFLLNCAQNGIVITEEFAADVVRIYREANAPVVHFWKRIEKACVAAMETRNGIGFGHLKFRKERNWLTIELPQRKMYYHAPKVETVDGYYGPEKKLSFRNASGNREATYGGKLTENVVQAISRDILALALIECERRGLEVVMHVHDSLTVQCKTEDVGKTVAEVNDIMTTTPKWASGLPLNCETIFGKRYKS